MDNNFVFQSFKYKLGMQQVDWDSEINIWLTPKLKSDGCFPGLENYPSANFSNINCSFVEETASDWVKVGRVMGFNFDTVNQVTGVEGDNTYEAMESFPASAYIFSDECPNECWVPKDYEYCRQDADHYNNTITKSEYWNNDYWENNYGFAPYYDSAEFEYYNIKEHKLNEDLVRISAYNNDISAASAFDFDKYKGDGCVITYSTKIQGQEKFLYHPICYVEFNKKHGLANGKLKIDWATDGCIQVK